MFSAVRQRFDREEEGFTLIELMVVLLIIAILLAIAIPTFLGARNRANARSTEVDLRNALTAEQTYWTGNQTFATNLASTEVSLTWETSAPVRGAADVYATTYDFGSSTPVTTTSSDGVLLEGYARDDNCYAIYQSNDATTDFTAYYQEASSNGACPAITPPGTAPVAGSNATTNTGGSASDGGWSATF
jgi:type IV pilus assembly protein PilA